MYKNPRMFRRDVGEKLRVTREEYLGLSLREVEERTGIPKTTISRIESGDSTIDLFYFCLLADFYQISITFTVGLPGCE